MSSTGEHPLGWACGDGVIVRGEYCFRELALEQVGVRSVALGDLTGNGRAEIVLQTPDELRSYALREDDTFELLVSWGDGGRTATSTITLLIGDFDADGKADVIRRESDQIDLFAQQPDGAMALMYAGAPVEGMGISSEVLDVDRDGSEELLGFAVEDPGWGTTSMVGWKFVDRTWSHTAFGFDLLYAGDWAFADVDRDGVQDLAVTLDPSLATDPPPGYEDFVDYKAAHLGRVMPDGSGIVLAATLRPGFYAETVQAGDLDGDGEVDLLFNSAGSKYDYDEPSPHRVLYWGRGDFAFEGPIDIGDAFGTVCDLDGDGVSELVSSTPDAVWTYSADNGSFIAGALPSDLRIGRPGQINVDGVVDYVIVEKGPSDSSTDQQPSPGITLVISDP